MHGLEEHHISFVLDIFKNISLKRNVQEQIIENERPNLFSTKVLIILMKHRKTKISLHRFLLHKILCLTVATETFNWRKYYWNSLIRNASSNYWKILILTSTRKEKHILIYFVVKLWLDRNVHWDFVFITPRTLVSCNLWNYALMVFVVFLTFLIFHIALRENNEECRNNAKNCV